ncbi:MAG: Hpt domain-containing protein [Lachnospiraceae bacterium]|nr:Hpt domain-containing protein [Lachnospiraceae bacterium]
MLKDNEKDEDWRSVLRGQGVNVDKALERMKGNEVAYRDFLIEFFADPDFESLEEAVKAGDAQAAFDCAHGLKGMAANLGLVEICHRLSVLVEILRKEQIEGAAEAFGEVMSACGNVTRLLYK